MTRGSRRGLGGTRGVVIMRLPGGQLAQSRERRQLQFGLVYRGTGKLGQRRDRCQRVGLGRRRGSISTGAAQVHHVRGG